MSSRRAVVCVALAALPATAASEDEDAESAVAQVSYAETPQPFPRKLGSS